MTMSPQPPQLYSLTNFRKKKNKSDLLLHLMQPKFPEFLIDIVKTLVILKQNSQSKTLRNRYNQLGISNFLQLQNLFHSISKILFQEIIHENPLNSHVVIGM